MMCQRRSGFYPLLLWTSYINSPRLSFLICKMARITGPEKYVLRIKGKVPRRSKRCASAPHTQVHNPPRSFHGPVPTVPWHQPHSGNRAIGNRSCRTEIPEICDLAHIRSSLWLRSETASLPRRSHTIRPHSVMLSSGEMSFRVQSTQACCVSTWRRGRGRDGKRPNPGFSPPSVVQSL